MPGTAIIWGKRAQFEAPNRIVTRYERNSGHVATAGGRVIALNRVFIDVEIPALPIAIEVVQTYYRKLRTMNYFHKSMTFSLHAWIIAPLWLCAGKVGK